MNVHKQILFERAWRRPRSPRRFAGSAWAQGQPVKIGLLATLEGPFAAGGADGMRGAELAVKQRNGMVAGRKIEIIKASSDAKPDVAVNATRKLVEQDKVDIMVGPLSGGEGIAVKDYSKTQPQRDLHQRRLGRAGDDAGQPERRTSSASTPKAGSGWWASARRRSPRATSSVMVIAEDYAFPYSQVQGFMAEYCKARRQGAGEGLGAAGRQGLLVGDRADPEGRRRAAGRARRRRRGELPQPVRGRPAATSRSLGGSITVSQDVLNYRGKRRDSLVGTLSAGPLADAYDGAEWKAFVADYQKNFPVSAGGFPSPSCSRTSTT